jgi:hypothetical protein
MFPLFPCGTGCRPHKEFNEGIVVRFPKGTIKREWLEKVVRTCDGKILDYYDHPQADYYYLDSKYREESCEFCTDIIDICIASNKSRD